MKEEYIQKRKEIVDKIHAWKYVDDNYFITAKFYEDYDTANLLLGLGASILIALILDTPNLHQALILLIAV